MISEISEGLRWVEIRWFSGDDEVYLHVCFCFGLQVPVFIHLQKKMTGWLDCCLAGLAIVPSLMCHAGEGFAGIQDESNDKVHPKTTIFFSEAFERGSSFAMGFSWEFPE